MKRSNGAGEDWIVFTKRPYLRQFVETILHRIKCLKLLTTFLFIVLLASCNTKTKARIQFADTSYLPKDSLAFYFPRGVFSIIPRVDSFDQNWYS
jgi:hypothetical protein